MTPVVRKEIRALIPTWLACLLGLGVAGSLGDDVDLLAFAFLLGSAVLGAQSMGHEYTHRTLALLLSQPIDRRRLFLLKHAMIAPMLLSHAALAWVLISWKVSSLPLSLGYLPLDLLLVTLGSLTVAPYLTMRLRSPLAGGLFAASVVGWLWILGEWLGIAWYGRGNAVEIEHLRGLTFWNGTLAVCALSAVAGWRLFMRLEATDGPDPEVRLPSWLRRERAAVTAARPRHPMWLLVRKELRLQRMTLSVAAVFVAFWVAGNLVSLLYPDPFGVQSVIGSVAGVSSAMLALVIGSLASAEERRLGTLEWQVLLPVAAWKQWGIKVGVAMSLAALFCLGLPVLVVPGEIGLHAGHAVAILALTTVSLYVSSLCASGMTALVVSGVAMQVIGAAQSAIPPSLIFAFRQAPSVAGLMLAAVLALMIRLAFENHRSADRGARRVVLQVTWMAGFVTMGIVLLWTGVAAVS